MADQPRSPSESPDGERSEAALPRWAWAAAGLILLLHALLAWQTRTAGVTHSNDDALYALLGESLEQFSYREAFRVGTPLHGQYPPAWPALIAITNLVSGHREAALFGLTALLSTAGMLLFFDVARRLLPVGLALGVLAAAALNPYTVSFGGRLMSEAAYWFWTALTIWALAESKENRRFLALAAVAALLAAFTRSIGVTLVGGVLVAWALERRWRPLAVLAVLAVVLLGAWMAYTVHAHEDVVGRSYLADAGDYLERIGQSDSPGAPLAQLLAMRIREQLVGAIPAMLPLPRFKGTLADNLLWLAVSAGFGLAGVLSLRRRLGGMAFYLILYYGLLSVWPFAPRRFFIPIQPLVVLTLVIGALAVAGVRRPRLGAGVASLLLAAILAAAVPQTLRGVRNMADCDRDAPWTSQACYGPDQQSFFAAVTFARDSLPPDAVFLVEREAAFAYHTGRRVEHAQIPLGFTDEEFLSFLDDRGLDYVLVTHLTDVELQRLAKKLLATCRRFELVRRFPPYARLYRFLPALAPAGADACSDLSDYVATTPSRGWTR